MNRDRDLSLDLERSFHEVYQYYSPTILDDVEMLYVVGLMAHYFPWALGDEKEWENIAETYRLRSRTLAPNGIDPKLFSNRSFFGDYFEDMATNNKHY